MTLTQLSNRAVIRIAPTAPNSCLSGADKEVDGQADSGAGQDSGSVAAFLQRLVTNDVTEPLPVYAALLTAQGKTQFDFIIWPGTAGGADEAGTSLLIDCEKDAADALIARLKLYRLRAPIEISRADELRVGWAAPNGECADPSANTSPDSNTVTNAKTSPIPTQAVHDPRLPALGKRWLMRRGDASGLPLGEAAWLAHRLGHGVAEGRAELGDILWLETNADLLNGVSFTKGCYIGQENTARMNWRAKINRRLVVVPIAQSEPKRQKQSWPELGLALDHLRLADITAPPPWMAEALRQED